MILVCSCRHITLTKLFSVSKNSPLISSSNRVGHYWELPTAASTPTVTKGTACYACYMHQFPLDLLLWQQECQLAVLTKKHFDQLFAVHLISCKGNWSCRNSCCKSTWFLINMVQPPTLHMHSTAYCYNMLTCCTCIVFILLSAIWLSVVFTFQNKSCFLLIFWSLRLVFSLMKSKFNSYITFGVCFSWSNVSNSSLVVRERINIQRQFYRNLS